MNKRLWSAGLGLLGLTAGCAEDTAGVAPAFTQDPATVFINELHYDNGGTDAGEAVEIAGPAGTDLTGWSVLDAFAGTGVLGFEAASRGATAVQMLERETRLVAALASSKAKLGAAAVTITQADAMAWMLRAGARWDDRLDRLERELSA